MIAAADDRSRRLCVLSLRASGTQSFHSAAKLPVSPIVESDEGGSRAAN